MRLLIYLLLVVNLVYFGLHVIQDMTVTEVVRAVPPVPPGVKSLVMLQEMELGDTTAVESGGVEELTRQQPLRQGDTTAVEPGGVEELTRQQPPGAGGALHCQTLGPFAAIDDLRPVETWLQESGLNPSRRTTDESRITGYWVYLPEMPRESALAARETLREHKFRDFFIGKGNFISLGTFRHKSRAGKHAQRVSEIGLDAQIKPRTRTRNLHWLDLDEAEAQTARETILQEFPDIEMQALTCP